MIEILQSKNNPEDVDTKMEDHAVDSLRYGLQSRPLTPIQRQGQGVLKRIQSYDKGVSWMAY